MSSCTITGVVATRVGYTGGSSDHPTYHDVCGHLTGHAEAVEVTFDPEPVSYAESAGNLLAGHDPTQLNRQGPDVGTQYRSAIFYHSEEQQRQAQESLERLDAPAGCGDGLLPRSSRPPPSGRPRSIIRSTIRNMAAVRVLDESSRHRPRFAHHRLRHRGTGRAIGLFIWTTAPSLPTMPRISPAV